jgi:type IV pilus assembly protein PilM
MTSDELKQALKFEAQKHIPFSISEVNLDGCILKPDLPDNKMLVLLAAAKKDFVNQRIKAVEEAGVRVNLIDVNSIAIINAFNFSYSKGENLKNKTIALLNVGESISSLNILDNGIPGLSRDIHIGGNNFTQKIADTFRIDFNSAQDLKLNPDKERLTKVVVSIEAVFSNLAQEISASFDYYESHGLPTIQKIFLTGGGSLFPGAKDILANLLGIEVEHWNPLGRINIANRIDIQKLNALSARLAEAVGIALRS